MANNNLLRLLHLCDPALPIGGFAHSAGLETYVQSGIIKDKITAESFIKFQLRYNIKHTDAALLSLAFEAASKGDIGMLVHLDQECSAVKLPREIREASLKLGKRLMKLFHPFYPHRVSNSFLHSTEEGITVGHYCIVFGMYAFLMEVDKEDALTGFFYNATAGMVTNCVKLIPLGQQEGQELLFSQNSLIKELAQQSLNPERNLIGYCCPGFDIRSMQHEELYSRLYMS